MAGSFFSKHPIFKHLIFMLGVSVVLVVLAFMLIKVIARQGKEYELPDYRGEQLEQLKKSNPYDLRYVVIDSVYDAAKDGGIVVMQEPEAGTMIKTGRKVYVTLTKYEPADVLLPDLSNMTVRGAVSELEARGLRCGRLRFVDSPYRNAILESYSNGKMVYVGEKMSSGAVVDLTVGRGAEEKGTRVPFVIGQSPAKARRGILSASLNVGQEHYEEVTDRSKCVCYRLSPDYTGVTRYPLGTSVEMWYCDATEEDVERIIQNFKVDSSQIVQPEYAEEESVDPYWSEPDFDFDDGWDW